MTTNLDVFHFEEDGNSFENLCHTNGKTTWYARDLMRSLGYENWQSFRTVINRATNACLALDINVLENLVMI